MLYNRLRANHFNLNASLARKGYIESLRFRCGGECKGINHFVFECSEYEEQRIEFNLSGEQTRLEQANRMTCGAG